MQITHEMVTLPEDPSQPPVVQKLKEHQCVISVQADDRAVELAVRKVQKWLDKGNFVRLEINMPKVKEDDEEGNREAYRQAKELEDKVNS